MAIAILGPKVGGFSADQSMISAFLIVFCGGRAAAGPLIFPSPDRCSLGAAGAWCLAANRWSCWGGRGGGVSSSNNLHGAKKAGVPLAWECVQHASGRMGFVALYSPVLTRSQSMTRRSLFPSRNGLGDQVWRLLGQLR